jgi:hypothetical protein
MGSNMEGADFVSKPVSVAASIAAGRPVAMTDVDHESQLAERAAFLEAMQLRDEDGKPNEFVEKFLSGVSAGQFCVSRRHVERVERFHAVFDRAIVDLVERWYSDEKRALPARMPLMENEEKILRVCFSYSCFRDLTLTRILYSGLLVRVECLFPLTKAARAIGDQTISWRKSRCRMGVLPRA